MTLPDPIPTTLSDQLRQVGLTQTATDVNDLIARATQKRWSPVVNRTGFVGGPIRREDGTHGTSQ